MEKKVSYWIKKLLLLASQYYNTELKLEKNYCILFTP